MKTITRGPTTGRDIPDDINVERFFSKIKVNQNNNCWEWQGALQSGYGFLAQDKVSHRVHRVSYKIFKGSLIKGMVIDHICRNKSCVNPDHLRQVDQHTNTFENSENIMAKNKQKTHCKRGHEFTIENTTKEKTGRSCRECRKMYLKICNLRRKVITRRSSTPTIDQVKEKMESMIL